MPQWGQLSFQDASSLVMLKLISFHDHALIVLTLVLTLVGYSMFNILVNKNIDRFAMEAHLLETVWTVSPAAVLLFLALPSLRLLYVTDEALDPSVTIKIVGHQWYWSYEYTDFMNIEFDSYMLPASDLSLGEYRLLEVDNRIVVPMRLESRLMITAADVIHSWTVPSLGVKIDAVPGRLNQISITPMQPGVFYGQCSEICGANHSFMPIAVESVNVKSFANWIMSFN
uniref:Cytochrome c oxidase subunit 2 n=1 Tax=Drawida japonica TaxID=408826 RepID=A0A0N6YQX7_9ANNE|nr:cytochrome c oxidase subunit II [Drawida japonica]AIR76344.1 cytochrome c oxidase subunit II [Drawida japonica]